MTNKEMADAAFFKLTIDKFGTRTAENVQKMLEWFAAGAVQQTPHEAGVG